MADLDLLIIGTGSGNTILTHEFESWRVGIVERHVFGGTCLNAGCIPSKMLVLPADRMVEAAEATERLGVEITPNKADWPAIRDRIFGRIDPIAASGTDYRKHQDHVRVFQGDARFVGDRTVDITMPDGTVERVSAEQVVLAAGARPVVPDIEGLADTPFHTSDSIMRIDSLPEHLIILGGGFIAAELGHVFSALGSKVTVVHRGDRMLRHEDGDISARFTECFAAQVDLRLRTTARAVRHDADGFTLDLVGSSDLALDPGDGHHEQLRGDALLITTGRVPNGAQLEVERTGVQLDDDGYVITDHEMRTGAPGVWALGDIRNHFQLKHLANQEAKVVRHNLLHPDSPIRIHQDVTPHAVFGHPQIGSVGATEMTLRNAERLFVTGRCDYAGVAYGWALEDTTGFAKLLIDPVDLQILGGHVLGPQAATLVQQIAQAMTFRIPADRLAREQVWCHPALPELLENALLDGLSQVPRT
jgi:mycothione reductase